MLNSQVQPLGQDSIPANMFNMAFETVQDKANNMTCAPSKYSDQPGHPHSLISLRCPYEEALGSSLFLEHTVKALIRPRGCAG